MKIGEFLDELSRHSQDNRPVGVNLSATEHVLVYPRSIHRLDDDYLFMARRGLDKYLYVVRTKDQSSLLEKFDGESVRGAEVEAGRPVRRCPLNHQNAMTARQLFDFARPVLIGTADSFGLGDRLGLANPGHLRAIAGSGFRPVLAQQSIRELERTERTPEEVMDAATWAVLQEGFKDGFGADADHLKTTKDIDRTVAAGFTMFTFDPGEYVVNEADSLPVEELSRRAGSLPWGVLEETYEGLLARYEDRDLRVEDGLSLRPDREEVLRALVKYGVVIAHAVQLYRHLKQSYPDHPSEVELSVDETESVTSAFEHFFIASELKRLGVDLVSLAPRFVGEFEKGIDYKGDLGKFTEEYEKHIRIAEALGPYKISIHSGSDKYSVYQAIGSLGRGRVHVKTAGTSYLEALRVVAAKQPVLFREILDFARERFETEKRSYHVSADVQRVPTSESCSDGQLLTLFDEDDARQVLHVTFGMVLTVKDAQGNYIFRDRILTCLKENEETYYDYLQNLFHRHIEPFKKNR